MILKLTITVFVTQLIFIGCRTWNVRAVSAGNLKAVLVSGAIVHIAWLVGIAVGAVSMNEIIMNFDWQYIPVVFGSLSGGLIGSWLGLKNKSKKA